MVVPSWCMSVKMNTSCSITSSPSTLMNLSKLWALELSIKKLALYAYRVFCRHKPLENLLLSGTKCSVVNMHDFFFICAIPQ